MPIFEYICQSCGKKFEAIVFGSKTPECPACHGQQLEQQLSAFAVSTGDSASARTAPCGAPSGACGSGGGT